ncbi:hypothetical protein CEXT_373291 [Caerostris extrusa]|uniref:Uncharacterized protein n=1 Tax=Caerostris extrusa TaxID=172846 RepID=A0AAV4QJ85_CAEEX|nr:hypothetical protein CEXT_373291 [Caerostris extrusa]
MTKLTTVHQRPALLTLEPLMAVAEACWKGSWILTGSHLKVHRRRARYREFSILLQTFTTVCLSGPHAKERSDSASEIRIWVASKSSPAVELIFMFDFVLTVLSKLCKKNNVDK